MSADADVLNRVVVIGTSGVGKTTFARELASALGAPHVEFDAYRHGPNWQETPDPLFRERLSEALAGERWVADGNYSVARDIVWTRATAVVWLDLSFGLVFWRLFWRTMRRGLLRTELWNGNRESLWWHFLSKDDSLFLWAMKTHWSRRKSLPIAFSQPGHAHLRVFRLRSSNEARRLLEGVRHPSSCRES